MKLRHPARCSTESARAILEALKQGRLAALEGVLERSAGLWPPPPGLASAEAERRELLDALIGQMRCALQRMRRGLSRRFEGLETVVSLLDHLARTPPRPIPLRVRR